MSSSPFTSPSPSSGVTLIGHERAVDVQLAVEWTLPGQPGIWPPQWSDYCWSDDLSSHELTFPSSYRLKT